jgi:hypothetical protein
VGLDPSRELSRSRLNFVSTPRDNGEGYANWRNFTANYANYSEAKREELVREIQRMFDDARNYPPASDKPLGIEFWIQ